MKKNCYSCKWLEYIPKQHDESYDSSGWCCHKREYWGEADERFHLDQLNEHLYKARYKKCFDPKSQSPHKE